MAKNTTRDAIWNAALRYAKDWGASDLDERKNKHGFTARELIVEHDLEASEKTVTDTLLSMADYGWLRKTSSGRGGHPTTFSK